MDRVWTGRQNWMESLTGSKTSPCPLRNTATFGAEKCHVADKGMVWIVRKI